MTTKKEASKVKARKTTLNKKSTNELIDIILRKDSVERKNNEKIKDLNEKLDIVTFQYNDMRNEYLLAINEKNNYKELYENKLKKFDKANKLIDIYKYGMYSSIAISVILFALIIFSV